MAFEKFIKQPMPEYLLIQKIVGEIRARYDELGEGHFYLRMARVSDVLTQIEWEHASESIEDHIDKKFESRISRAAISISFREDYWKVFFDGYFTGSEHRVYPNRTELLYFHVGVVFKHDQEIMPPKSVVLGGLADLGIQFNKKNKAS
jgi:hypothetical protein